MTEEINKTEEIKSELEIVEPLVEPSTPVIEKTVQDKCKINPALLALNIVMLLGLIVLYILHFKGSAKSDTGITGAIEKANKGSISVAFVNNDSILSNYDLVKKMRAELEAKGKRLEGEVATAQKSFEKDAAYFQEQVAKKAISEQSAQEIYAQLQQNQQKIYEMRDRYAAELQQSEMDMNVALLDSVMNFLQRYNENYKFDYILGFTKGGNILLANDTLDVTNDVIKALNLEYNKKHAGK